MHCNPPRRRFVAAAMAAALLPGRARAQPLEAGNFASFVAAGRVDLEIAHVLNVIDGYPAASWAKQVAAFVHHELVAGNLLGIVQATNAGRLLPLLAPFPAAVPVLPLMAARVGPAGSFVGMTVPVGSPGALKSYTLLRNAEVVAGTGPGAGRKFLAQVIAHEMGHVRNREVTEALKTRAIAPDLYFDTAEATRGPAAQLNASEYVAELVSNHLEWRMLKDIENKWEGRPAPRQPDPARLWNFCLDQGTGITHVGRNEYLRRLVTSASVPAQAFERQLALWTTFVSTNALFHDDPLKNAEARAVFAAAVAGAAPAFRRGVAPPDGGVANWTT